MMGAWYSLHLKVYALSEVSVWFLHEKKSSLDPARIELTTISMGGRCLTPGPPCPSFAKILLVLKTVFSCPYFFIFFFFFFFFAIFQ
jgi:hypothetical protein